MHRPPGFHLSLRQTSPPWRSTSCPCRPSRSLSSSAGASHEHQARRRARTPRRRARHRCPGPRRRRPGRNRRPPRVRRRRSDLARDDDPPTLTALRAAHDRRVVFAATDLIDEVQTSEDQNLHSVMRRKLTDIQRYSANASPTQPASQTCENTRGEISQYIPLAGVQEHCSGMGPGRRHHPYANVPWADAVWAHQAGRRHGATRPRRRLLVGRVAVGVARHT